MGNFDFGKAGFVIVGIVVLTWAVARRSGTSAAAAPGFSF